MQWRYFMVVCNEDSLKVVFFHIYTHCVFSLLPNRHQWVWGCPAVCLRPLHQYRRLLPVPVLPWIPANAGRQPLWRHEVFTITEPTYLTCVLVWNHLAPETHQTCYYSRWNDNQRCPNKSWLKSVGSSAFMGYFSEVMRACSAMWFTCCFYYLPFRYQWVWEAIKLSKRPLHQQYGLIPLWVPEGLHTNRGQEMPRSVISNP